MLTRIDYLSGIGLFGAAGPSPGFSRVTLVFGENGRGKSTLSAILRSCGEGSGSQLTPRATLGATLDQTAALSFTSSGGQQQLSLSDGAWNGSYADLVVFDADFVARNVYAGQEISSGHRASLLDFALGEEAVAARREHDSYAEPIRAANSELRDLTAAIDAKRGALSLAAYRNLADDPELDAKLIELQQRLQSLQQIDAVRARPSGADIVPPKFDLDELFAILRKSLPAIEADAEARVKAHIVFNGGEGFESWISSGLDYAGGMTCPFCENNIVGSSLIAAYRAHFNEEYKTLKVQSAQLAKGIEVRTSDAQVDRIERDLQTCVAQQQRWAEHLQVQKSMLDGEALREKFASLRSLLGPLAVRKSHAPLESIGSEDDEAESKRLWADIANAISATNSTIAANRAAIDAYKESLVSSSSASIRSGIARLEATKFRHSADGVQQLAEMGSVQRRKANLSAAKDAARTKLDTLMDETFGRLGDSINSLLREFGAQIQIKDLAISYRGAQNRPRTEYALEVRGSTISLTNESGASFGNSLSEGDKRALAFAFFMARVMNDPMLSQRVVVIDDPMCSLDRHRKATTLRSLKILALACRQLVLLAHDIWFLRDFDSSIAKLPSNGRPERSYVKITRVRDDLSSFSPLDIGAECQSPYQKNLSDVHCFVRGDGLVEAELVAKSLRPLVEGYVQRRFPLDVPRNVNFGEILRLIRNSATGDPLNAATGLLSELQAINDYTIPFMHVEGESVPDFSELNEGELLGFCERTLRVVYG